MTLLDYKGQMIHYRYQDNQSDRVLFFINSLGTDFRLWDEVLPGLRAFGNFLLYDKRGHGLSDLRPAPNGLEDYAEDALQLLSRFSTGKCIIIGISLGGMLAKIMAYRQPALFDKLVLCDTAPKIGQRESWDARISQVRAGGLESIADDVMQRWFAPPFHQHHPEKLAGYRNMFVNCPVNGYIQACEAIRDADLTEISRQLKMPALCLAGAQDPTTTPAQMQQMASAMPGAKAVVIPGSAHIPCVDSPDEFLKQVIDFIK